MWAVLVGHIASYAVSTLSSRNVKEMGKGGQTDTGLWKLCEYQNRKVTYLKQTVHGFPDFPKV